MILVLIFSSLCSLKNTTSSATVQMYYYLRSILVRVQSHNNNLLSLYYFKARQYLRFSKMRSKEKGKQEKQKEAQHKLKLSEALEIFLCECTH